MIDNNTRKEDRHEEKGTLERKTQREAPSCLLLRSSIKFDYVKKANLKT